MMQFTLIGCVKYMLIFHTTFIQYISLVANITKYIYDKLYFL